mmetsp:Transcript_17537/g.40819  ORF Transcript_17537/g.40819 Transcript_17537/m.40819 type:complete len:244 (-) Transcript_17537:134-865(-)
MPTNQHQLPRNSSDVEQRSSERGNRLPLVPGMCAGTGSAGTSSVARRAGCQESSRSPRDSSIPPPLQGRMQEGDVPSRSLFQEELPDSGALPGQRAPRAVSLPPANGLGGPTAHSPKDSAPCTRSSSLPPCHGVQLPPVDFAVVAPPASGSSFASNAAGSAAAGRSPTDGSKDYGRFPAIGEGGTASGQLSARQQTVSRRSGHESGGQTLRLPRVDDRNEERKVTDSHPAKRWATADDGIDLW